LNGEKHLAPFIKAIEAHFYQNRSTIIEEIHGWFSDGVYGRKRHDGTTMEIDKLKQLIPLLHEKLSKLRRPSFIGDEQMGAKDPSANKSSGSLSQLITPNYQGGNTKTKETEEIHDKETIHEKPAAMIIPTKEDKKKLLIGVQGAQEENEQNIIVSKRLRMQEVVQKGNYILAGQLQQEIQRLEELQRLMEKAAGENDFIRAGRLQEQLLSLTAEDSKPSSHDQDNNSDEVFESDGEEAMEDESSSSLDQGPPPPFYKKNRYNWGTGQKLISDESMEDSKKAASGKIMKASSLNITSLNCSKHENIGPIIPNDELCRLRIRLLTGKSVVEDFNQKELLSSVYRRLESYVSDDSGMNGKSNVAALAPSRAFSRPQSSAGYTLLLSRPKREFNLEMHGTKSLAELNLIPSASLTLMKCTQRGIVHRGELESRLQQAQGNAMELDGLTYEGLVELTERVGVAGVEDGTELVSKEEFEKNSESISQEKYLDFLTNSGMIDEKEQRCPICLGEYDIMDKTNSLRKLTKCNHVFHHACLVTWLETKSSCPLCNISVHDR